jgi:tetratricopeptide (TPR) repeat protein
VRSTVIVGGGRSPLTFGNKSHIIMSDDINQEIVSELRRIRSVGRGVFWLLLLLMIFSVLGALVSRRSRTESKTDSWSSVDTAMRQQDFPKALAEAQALVARQPNYYYGQAYLGAIYLAMGDLTNAETHYLHSYELFPNEEGEKDLAAVRKRIAAGGNFRLLTK